jgi:hypothetical protein
VDAMVEMAYRRLPFRDFSFSRLKEGGAASAFYQRECDALFGNTTMVANTGGPGGWPVAPDWKLHFKRGLMWAPLFNKFFPATPM